MTRSLLVMTLLTVTSCGRVLVLDDGGTHTCVAAGGTCGAVSACARGLGYPAGTADDCTGGSSMCCLPLSACNNATEFDCCSATATFRPSCENGALVCTFGTTRCTTDGGMGGGAGGGGGTGGGSGGGTGGGSGGGGGSTSTCTQLQGTCQTTCSGSFTPILQNGNPVTCAGGQFCCATAPADAGPTCASIGGTCGAVSACSAGMGYLTQSTSDCTGAASVCCLPLSACQSQPEFQCCSGNGQFRPSCENGVLQCTVGTRCDTADGGSITACISACGVGCAAPGVNCYSDGHDYCSGCVANCYGVQQVSCGG